MKKINRSVKLSDDLYSYAKNTSELNHRSIAAQIEYWVSIGANIEKKLNYSELVALLEENKLTN